MANKRWFTRGSLGLWLGSCWDSPCYGILLVPTISFFRRHNCTVSLLASLRVEYSKFHVRFTIDVTSPKCYNTITQDYTNTNSQPGVSRLQYIEVFYGPDPLGRACSILVSRLWSQSAWLGPPHTRITLLGPTRECLSCGPLTGIVPSVGLKPNIWGIIRFLAGFIFGVNHLMILAMSCKTISGIPISYYLILLGFRHSQHRSAKSFNLVLKFSKSYAPLIAYLSL